MLLMLESMRMIDTTGNSGYNQRSKKKEEASWLTLADCELLLKHMKTLVGKYIYYFFIYLNLSVAVLYCFYLIFLFVYAFFNPD